jgi:hypothetical protein
MKTIAIALFLFASATPLFAQIAVMPAPANFDWKKIAETTVGFNQPSVDKMQVAEILITGPARFASLHFKVIDAQIDLKSLEIYYENGDKQDVAVNEIIKSKSNSKEFDLNGAQRKIKKVVFKYMEVAHTDDKKVKLELWGSQFPSAVRKN